MAFRGKQIQRIHGDQEQAFCKNRLPDLVKQNLKLRHLAHSLCLCVVLGET